MIGPIKPDHKEYASIAEEMELVEKAVLFVAAAPPKVAS